MATVFISYKRAEADSKFVTTLRAELTKIGIETWQDINNKAGDNWIENIDDALRSSFALIVVLSRASSKSQYVTYEWAYAMGRDYPIVPLYLEKGAERNINPRLGLLQYLDFSNPDARPWSDLFERITTLKSGSDNHAIDIADHLNRIITTTHQTVVSAREIIDEFARAGIISPEIQDELNIEIRKNKQRVKNRTRKLPIP